MIVYDRETDTVVAMANHNENALFIRIISANHCAQVSVLHFNALLTLIEL